MLYHLGWSRSIAVFLMTMCLGIFVAGVSISASEVQASHNAPLLPTATPTTYYQWGIHGTVTDEQGNPLSGALIRMKDDSSYTLWNGKYDFGNVAPGTYDLTVEYGSAVFTPTVRTVTVPPSAENVDFQKLPPVTTHSIFGRITDHTGTGVPFVKVTTDYGEYVSDAGGSYTIHGLLAGTHHLTATSESMVFTPTVQTVTLPQEVPQSVDFTQQCESPNTGLNVCELQVGDILLWRGDFSIWTQNPGNVLARVFVGTYWWHAGMYIGSGKITEALGNLEDSKNEVQTREVINTDWWLGSSDYDWTVIRPRVTAAVAQEAARYVYRMEEQIDPPVEYVPSGDSSQFYNRDTDSPTYCNKLVWKAYMQSGVNLEADHGILGGTVFKEVITADDLYYSSVHFVGEAEPLSDVVQEKESPWNNRAIFFLLSPADLLLTDSLGRRVGYDSNAGIIYNEIPTAVYTGPDSHPESLNVEASKSLTWTLQLRGADQGGQYALQTAVISGMQLITQTVDSSILLDEIHTYTFTNDSQHNGELLIEQTVEVINNWYTYLPLIVKK